jgi:hypothetical protein
MVIGAAGVYAANVARFGVEVGAGVVVGAARIGPQGPRNAFRAAVGEATVKREALLF